MAAGNSNELDLADEDQQFPRVYSRLCSMEGVSVKLMTTHRCILPTLQKKHGMRPARLSGPFASIVQPMIILLETITPFQKSPRFSTQWLGKVLRKK